MALNLNFIAILKLKYVLMAILPFLGIYAGIALSYIAPEELKIGKKYLMLARDALLLLIFFLLITRLFSFYLAIPSLILLIPIILFYRIHPRFDKFTFIILAAVLIVTARFDMAVFATLIFAYAAIISILFITNFEKNERIAKKFWFIFKEVTNRYSWFLYVMIVFSIILLIA